MNADPGYEWILGPSPTSSSGGSGSRLEYLERENERLRAVLQAVLDDVGYMASANVDEQAHAALAGNKDSTP